jgi:2-keto-4-pentenoate hydratase/2-oxohepta-3-ene-1,7-dioic acid hydratase in catechol pathway
MVRIGNEAAGGARTTAQATTGGRMKLVSFEVATPIGPRVRVGALNLEGNVVDLQASYQSFLSRTGVCPDAAARISAAAIPHRMVDFIRGGSHSLRAAEEGIKFSDHGAPSGSVDGMQLIYTPDSVRWLAPVPEPLLIRDFMAFETHLQNIYPKLGREIPSEWYELPVYYKANPASVGAHQQDIAMPSYATELDFEFELGIVIGKDGSDIKREHALDHIYGMTIYNDFSAREIQAREMAVGLGPAKGKDFHNAHVFGPFLLTVDEIPDPYDLHMEARVNEKPWCADSSGTLHWKFEDMIAHASRDECVRAGEIFGSGTVGNGSGAERGEFLNRGDKVELEVSHLGTLINRVV